MSKTAELTYKMTTKSMAFLAENWDKESHREKGTEREVGESHREQVVGGGGGGGTEKQKYHTHTAGVFTIYMFTVQKNLQQKVGLVSRMVLLMKLTTKLWHFFAAMHY